MGVQRVGALNNRYTVYKNPYMLENDILLGFRANFLETGAVYAPYVPLIMTPLVYDPVNFTPRKGVMTRYAKKMVRPEFYGKVIVRCQPCLIEFTDLILQILTLRGSFSPPFFVLFEISYISDIYIRSNTSN